MRFLPTRHAQERFAERVGKPVRGGLYGAARWSIPLPKRLGARRWGTRKGLQKGAPKYRVSATTVLLCARKKVVTVLRATLDDLATVLTWLMTGQWCDALEGA